MKIVLNLMPNSKKNKFLHAFFNDAKKLQPDILDVEANVSPNPLDDRLGIRAEWLKKQKLRRSKKC